MKAWVEQQTEGGRYGNASGYVRDLIRKDQERKAAIETLQAAITAGHQSGEPLSFESSQSNCACASAMSSDEAKPYRLAPLALADLEAIWRYTAETWSIRQADLYTDDLTRVFETIAT